MKKINPLFWGCLFIFTACFDEPDPKALKNFGYDISRPSKIHELDVDLEEISGLCATSASTLACIEDESGEFFSVDVNTGNSTNLFEFGPNDDYEGVAVVGKDAFVVSSKGDIYHIPDFSSLKNKENVKKYETKLGSKANIEGLCHHPGRNALLLAGKGEPAFKDMKHKKVIYSFDLERKNLDAKPFLVIELKEIESSLGKKKGLGKLDNIFQPSGIAIHPLSGDIYILSHINKLLAIYSASGKLKIAVSIRSTYSLQPEGITFTPNGDMYISNEGKGGKPNILKYAYEK